MILLRSVTLKDDNIVLCIVLNVIDLHVPVILIRILISL